MISTTKVDNYIEDLPEGLSEVAAIIRSIIRAEVPNVVEKFSFGIPFYHYHGMFCYLNLHKKTGGLEFVFCRGADLTEAFPELQTSGRAMVAGILLQQGQPVNYPLIRQMIQAAADWQATCAAEKRGFVKKPRRRKN
ncbi:MAG: DUF1801 domain-containing protein [Chitinophagaceae bacterium]|jgi:hypothetical protein|nr:DUF1801 domain-containing protein [Chitinophagaceae bacterium]